MRPLPPGGPRSHRAARHAHRAGRLSPRSRRRRAGHRPRGRLLAEPHLPARTRLPLRDHGRDADLLPDHGRPVRLARLRPRPSRRLRLGGSAGRPGHVHGNTSGSWWRSRWRSPTWRARGPPTSPPWLRRSCASSSSSARASASRSSRARRTRCRSGASSSRTCRRTGSMPAAATGWCSAAPGLSIPRFSLWYGLGPPQLLAGLAGLALYTCAARGRARCCWRFLLPTAC